MSESHTPLRSFGRIRGRTIKPRQAALMQTLLPNISLATTPFDPLTLMPDATAIWLEIGFGGGEHLATQAARHPERLLLGAEPFINGVASALRHIDEQGLKNVRLWAGDARELMGNLPDACLERLYLLFPDPWPKLRHHKRRIVDPAFVAEAARVLKPGGAFRSATDWADYANQMLEQLTKSSDFAWSAVRSADWMLAPADHVPTRYEEKRLGDCAPIWLEFIRS